MPNIKMPVVYDEPGQAISYGSEGAAGMDLRSSINYELKPGERKLIPTGVRAAIPEGYVGMVCPRSGLAIKHGITIVNAPGIVDCDYRGEICVILLNTDCNAPFKIEKGDRIAQIIIAPYAKCELVEVDTLDDTERGEGGFCSTGVK